MCVIKGQQLPQERASKRQVVFSKREISASSEHGGISPSTHTIMNILFHFHIILL